MERGRGRAPRGEVAGPSAAEVPRAAGNHLPRPGSWSSAQPVCIPAFLCDSHHPIAPHVSPRTIPLLRLSTKSQSRATCKQETSPADKPFTENTPQSCYLRETRRRLAGSISQTQDAWSRGCEFEPRTGCRDYVKMKSSRKKGRKCRTKNSTPVPKENPPKTSHGPRRGTGNFLR